MEFLLIGWLVQLAMGVAFWILPRFAGRVPRGNERLVWLAFFLLNAGIWLVIVRPWLPPAWPSAAGRLLEAGAMLAYVVGSWRRVKPAGA
jgi:type II secretory pathway component PulM